MYQLVSGYIDLLFNYIKTILLSLFVATCLQSVNVTFCDTRDIDIMPRERFHPFAVQHHLFPPGIDSNWYLQMKYYPSIEVSIIVTGKHFYCNKNYLLY